ncbi:MAG: SRPBCC family protein [Acidobacteriota bacterium]
MTEYILERSTLLDRPRSEVFAFFSDPANLETLTPPWLNFRILTPKPIEMRAGALIDYRISFHGLPLRWRSEITAWEPLDRFVDQQRRGPYRSWVHEHRFIERGEATEVIDRVRYCVLGGKVIQRLFVARDLERIFEYRTMKMIELMPPSQGARPPVPLRLVKRA